MTQPSSQPIGAIVDRLPPRKLPTQLSVEGQWVRLEALDPARHGADLQAGVAASDARMWRYLGYGPFADAAEFNRWLSTRVGVHEVWTYSFVSKAAAAALGVGAFMRPDAANGVIEIGHIWMTDRLQRTRESTDSIYLMMRHAFEELGVRRLEWKCDALNAPSRAAAERFGFTHEGIFRQHFIVKGRNRDTAWYAIMDHEWPGIRQGFDRWLAPENFDAGGRQRSKLQVR